MKTSFLTRSVVVVVLSMASVSFGFAEDLGPNASGKLGNCLTDGGCVSGAGRSMVHVDATYAIAQALGFREDVAYWIAAYSEATDLGTYTPFDQCGVMLTDAGYATENIGGVVRSSASTGGTSIHFPLAYSRTDGGDLLAAGVTALYPYLQYGVQNAEAENGFDGQLAHFRRWAFTNDGGATPLLCTAGFTNATTQGDGGTSFYAGGLCADGGTVTGKYPLFKNGDAGTFNVATGRQQVTGGAITNQTLANALANGQGRLWATSGTPTVPVELARLGIYLHSLQDRVSHQYCHDVSYANRQGTSYRENYSPLCTNTAHTNGHVEEIGQATLPLRDFTALNITYDELKAFRDRFPSRDWYRVGGPLSVTKEQLIGQLVTNPDDDFSSSAQYAPGTLTSPLTQADAAARLAAMNNAMLGLGLKLMPGMSAVCR